MSTQLHAYYHLGLLQSHAKKIEGQIDLWDMRMKSTTRKQNIKTQCPAYPAYSISGVLHGGGLGLREGGLEFCPDGAGALGSAVVQGVGPIAALDRRVGELETCFPRGVNALVRGGGVGNCTNGADGEGIIASRDA